MIERGYYARLKTDFEWLYDMLFEEWQKGDKEKCREILKKLTELVEE
jgi:hypothetical protein